MKLTQEKQDKLVEMFTMKVQGKTYQEIGDIYGITRQAVQYKLNSAMNKQMLLPKHSFKRRKLAEWIVKNEMSVTEFANLIEVTGSTIRCFLKGSNINSKSIGKILNLTGLSFEDLEKEN